MPKTIVKQVNRLTGGEIQYYQWQSVEEDEILEAWILFLRLL